MLDARCWLTLHPFTRSPVAKALPEAVKGVAQGGCADDAEAVLFRQVVDFDDGFGHFSLRLAVDRKTSLRLRVNCYLSAEPLEEPSALRKMPNKRKSLNSTCLSLTCEIRPTLWPRRDFKNGCVSPSSTLEVC